MRSPRSAPRENGLDGSTETTPTVRSPARRVLDERADQGRLADAGRPGDADHAAPPRLRIELADERIGERVAVLDQGDRPSERAPVSRSHTASSGRRAPTPACATTPLYALRGRSPTAPVPSGVAAAFASLSRRTSISSSRTAMRSSPAAAEPLALASVPCPERATRGSRRTLVERDEGARRRLAVGLEEVIVAGARHRKPARHEQRGEGADERRPPPPRSSPSVRPANR